MLAVTRNTTRRVYLSPPCLCFRRWQRCLSTSQFDPSIRDFTSTLAQKQPAFTISPSDIRILSQPTQFYSFLLDMIRRAQTRIFISSLYIGSAESELMATLRESLETNPSLHLHLHLDLNRSTRPGPSSTAQILLPLLCTFPSRVHVSLFRSPSLRGILAKLVPPRFNEGWGTWHAKIYGVDDEIMISGANLNKSYFTNRQDRYIHFSAQPALARYCFEFLQTVSTFSYKLLPSPASFSQSPPSHTSTLHSYYNEEYTLQWPDPHTHPHHIHRKAETAISVFQARYRQPLLNTTPSPNTISSQDLPPSAHSKTGDNKIILFPIIQAGQFNVREEESALALLFRSLNHSRCHTIDSHSHSGPEKFPSSKLHPSRSTLQSQEDLSYPHPLVDLTSGYFGLYKPYQDLILASPGVDCRVVAASPKANGFYGSRGISGRIPEGYTLLEQRFMSAVERAGRSWVRQADEDVGTAAVEDSGMDLETEGVGRGVQLTEWGKDGWTYHAKGIWLSPTPTSPPVLTLFGSTNLNSRSAHLDTELSFLMVIPSKAPSSTAESDSLPSDPESNSSTPSSMRTLRQQLASEIRGLRAHSRMWKGGERKVPFGTKMIVGLVGGML